MTGLIKPVTPAILQDIEKLCSIKDYDYDLYYNGFLDYYRSRYGLEMPEDESKWSVYEAATPLPDTEDTGYNLCIKIAKGQLQYCWWLFWEFAP